MCFRGSGDSTEVHGIALNHLEVYGVGCQWVTVHNTMRAHGAALEMGTLGDWVTIRTVTLCTRVWSNIHRLSRKAEGPRPLRRIVSRANLGYWHPSTTDMILFGVTDSHPLILRRKLIWV